MRQQPATSNVRFEGKAADRSHPAGSGTLPAPDDEGVGMGLDEALTMAVEA